MPTDYGADPAPPRYFFIKQETRAVESESAAPELEEKAEARAKPKSKDLDWRQFVLVVMRALVPFPEAGDAVMAAFRDAGAEASP